MTDRSLRRAAWALYSFILALVVVGALLKGRLTYDDIFGIPFFAFATMGVFVATRQPRNPVGWVFMFVGLTPTLGFFTSSYAYRSLQTGDGLPASTVMEWVSSWAWFPGIGALITFGLLLFPDGKLPSQRWRSFPYVAAVYLFVVTASMAFKPGLMEPFDATLPSHTNPFGLESAAVFMETLEGVSFSLFPLFALICASSLVLRFRRSGTEQRQQIKWFAYSALMLVLIVMFEDVFDLLLGERVAELVFLVGMIFPSVGAGIGILKYRLFDIDVVINRTLVYAVLTGALALVYLGVVVVMQGALGSFTEDSDLAIAASTLAVAGLFRPFRTRIQAFIDRRFYRRKYDAQLTLESFSSRLRDTVDLDSLNQALVGVVGETMQPLHASVWIRPAGGVS